MPGFHTEWTVFPHGPVETIDDGIFSVEGEIRMPLGTFPRRMTIAALASGGSVVFSPVALHEPAMREIEALGPPRFMVVPNGFHRLDARIWKQRYPHIKVICPPGAKKRVAQAVAVDATSDILGDESIGFIITDGTRRAESALLVQRSAGSTLVINDLVSHIRHPKGLARTSLPGFSASASNIRKWPARFAGCWSMTRPHSLASYAIGPLSLTSSA